MDDLTAFITARLDEDEAAAGESYHEGQHWLAEEEGVYRWPEDELVPSADRKADARHIARHDPARVLREVAAKRAIMAEHSPHYPVTYPQPSGQPTCTVCDEGGFDPDPVDWPCPTVRYLAAVWSDHPDYRREWAAPSPAVP